MLRAVDGISATDVWAVGFTINPRGIKSTPLALHWNGRKWNEVATPRVDNGSLLAVAAISSDDVWAVGDTGWESATLVEHWDGRVWQVVDAPRGTGGYNRLTDVGFVSAQDVLATGYSNSGEDPPEPIRLHWDGSSWTHAPARYDGITALDAISATEAWSVGETPVGKTLARHWNGTRWKTVPTEDVAAFDSLTNVETISSHDVWALGEVVDPGRTAFAEHWDGTRWTTVDVSLPGPDPTATAISAGAPDDVWLTGYSAFAAILMHWDGHRWSRVHNPGNRGSYPRLDGVAAFSRTEMPGRSAPISRARP